MRKCAFVLLAASLLMGGSDVITDKDRLELKSLEAEYYRLQLQAERTMARYRQSLDAAAARCKAAGQELDQGALACRAVKEAQSDR